MKKIICILCVSLILVCTFCFSVFADVTVNENPYFSGTYIQKIGSATLDGSYSSYPLGVYIDGSVDMPFHGVNGTTGGETQLYNYSSISDLIIDYTNYRQGLIRFTIEFYQDDTLLTSFDIRTNLNDNNTGAATDDFYEIAAFSGNDNLDTEYKKIVPLAQPYIAFNLGALLFKSYDYSLNPTHFKVSFLQSDCEADFRIYGVINNYDETFYDIYDKGYNDGYVNGEQNGYSSGYTKGHSVGKEDGIASVDKDAVYNEGWEQGFTDGVMTDDAYDVGFEDGKEWQHNYDMSVGEVSNFFYDIGGIVMSAFLYVGNNIHFMGISLLAILGIIVIGLFAYFGVKCLKGN